MTIKLQLPRLTELKPRIVVVGVGGAGGNAINNMIASGLSGVEFVAANTDAQALLCSSAERRIQLGAQLTEGLGAGSKPEIGEAAAEEAIAEIQSHIAGAHMVFIAAGMGGGTGTGAAGVIARAARDADILTVGVVTKPFLFEGARRMRAAEAGIAELKKHVDTLIVIPNQNIFRIANEKTTFAEAFVLADQILYSGIACIVDLIVKEGLINLDFADVRTVMRDMGTAMMGTGEASGPDRAVMAAEEAISNPLLDEITLRGARGLLVSIIGGHDMTLFEVDAAANRVRQEVDPDANIIVGASFDESMSDRLRVAIVASGMQLGAAAQPAPAQAVSAGQQAGLDPRAQPPVHASPQGQQQAPSYARAQPSQAQLPPIAGGGAAQGPPPIPGAAAGAPARPVQPSIFSAPRPGAPQWSAPGGIEIEEALPPPVAHAQPQPQRAAERLPALDFSHDPMPPPEPFVPSAPSEIRRAAGRIPPIEAFPAVGQREYRARAGERSEPVAAPQLALDTSGQAGGTQRRGGLLQRLVSRSRRTPPESAPAERESEDGQLPDFFDRKRS